MTSHLTALLHDKETDSTVIGWEKVTYSTAIGLENETYSTVIGWEKKRAWLWLVEFLFKSRVY
jgi:hypothetical protein